MTPDTSMRDTIKGLAIKLLIRHGYAGFRFRDLADELGITRAGIHYHFRSKTKLCEETITEHIARSTAWYASLLSDKAKTFTEKVEAIASLNRTRYLEYNPTGTGTNAWALISRIRLEREALTKKTRLALSSFRSTLEESCLECVAIAVQNGELSNDTPARDLALLLVAIINSSDPTTRDTGSFKRMDELYESYVRVARAAYGANGKASYSLKRGPT